MAQQRTIGAARSAQELKDNMDAIATVAANTGRVSSANMERISLALGQIQTKGHLAGGEILQLTEAGVNMTEILTKHFGVTGGQLQEMISKGKVSAQDVFAAMREFAADPRNREALDKLANTWEGALSTISDVGKKTIADTFRPMFDLMTEGAVAVANFLQADQFKVWAEAARLGFTAISDGIKGLLASFAPLGKAISDAFSQATQGDFSGALSTLADGVKTQLGVIWESVTSFGSQMLGAGENVIRSFAEGMLSGGYNAIVGAIDAITTFIADMLIGHSPPKAGPLSELDQGGANAAMAWAGPFGDVMLKEVGGAVAATAGTISQLKDASRDAAGQIRDINEQSQELDRTIKGLKERIGDIKDGFAATTRGVKEAAEASKQHYADAIQGVRDQIDTIKDRHEQAAQGIQKQIDGIKDQYGAAIDGVRAKIDGIKEKYDAAESSIQRQIDQVKDKYGAAIEALRVKIDGIKESYDQQETSLQRTIDKLKDQYSTAIDKVRDQIDKVKESYDSQESALQRQIDLVKDGYAAAIDGVQSKIDAVQESYGAQEQALQRQIDLTKDKYGDALDGLRSKIDGIKDGEAAALDPLQRQLDLIQKANSLVRERQDAERSIASAKIQQMQLDALGDPVLRAQLAGQLASLDAQKQSVDLAKEIEDAQQKLGGKDGSTPLERAALELKIKQLTIQKQLADMVDATKVGEAAKQQSLQESEQKRLDITRSIEDANNRILAIPLKQKIEEIQKAAEAALLPLNQQLHEVEAAQKLALDPLQDKLRQLKDEEQDILGPLQAQLKQLERDQKLALDPLQDRLKAIKLEEANALAVLQARLKSLESDQKAALDPLQSKLKGIKEEEQDTLAKLQSRLKGLERDQKAALDPLQDKLRALKAEEADALAPLQSRLKQLERDQKAALDPLQDSLKKIKQEEQDALRPLEQRVKDLTREGKEADRVFDAMLSAIAQQQRDILEPLESQLTTYQHQKDRLTEQRQELERIKAQIGETIAMQQEAERAAKAAAKNGTAAPGAPAGGIDFQLDERAKAAAEQAKTAGANLAAKLGEGFQKWWDDNKTKVIEGVIGAVAGGLIGGPIGALAGAAFVPMFLDKLKEKLKERGIEIQPFLDALSSSAQTGNYDEVAYQLTYGITRSIARLPSQIGRGIWSAIGALLSSDTSGPISATRNVAQAMWDALRDQFVEDLTTDIAFLKRTGAIIGEAIINGLSSLADAQWRVVTNFGNTIIDKIREAFGLPALRGGSAGNEASAETKAIGKSVAQGLEDALSEEALKNDTGILGAAYRLGGLIIDTFKAVFGIASPSTVMHEIGVNLIDGLLGGVTETWDALRRWWSELPRNIQSAFGWNGSGFTWVSDLKAMGSRLLENIWDGLNDYWTQFSQWWTDLPKNIQTAFGWTGGAFTWVADLKTIGSTLLTSVWNGSDEYWQTNLSKWWADLPRQIQMSLGWTGGALAWSGDMMAAGQAILTGVGMGISDHWSTTMQPAWAGFKQAIFEAAGFSGAAEWLIGAGRDVLQSFWRGLNELWGDENNPGTVKGLLKQITDWIPDWIKQALGVHSPSQVMHDIGHNTMQGLINGLRAKFPDMQSTIREAMGHITGGFGGIGNVGEGVWQTLARRFAEEWGVPGEIFARQIQEESGFDPTAESPAGAKGIAQFMPGTAEMVARMMGVSIQDFWASPALQLQGAARHMHDLMEMFNGNIAAALVGYNAGPGGAMAWLANGGSLDWLAAEIPESRRYLRDILGLAQGGIVMPRPGGVFANIAEGGRPEAVIPLPRDWMPGQSAGGSSINLTVNVTVGTSLASRREIEEAVVVGVTEAVKRQRLSPSILRGGA